MDTNARRSGPADGPPIPEDLITVAEAARRLGVSDLTVRRWAKRGSIPVYRLGPGGSWSPIRVSWSELLAQFKHEKREVRDV